MATVLFLVAAATSHSPVHQNFWWSCKTPERTQCVSHEMPLQHRKPVGYWQAAKGARTVVYPYWKHQVRRIVRSAYRQVTRAVQTVSGRCYRVTGYWPSANHVADPNWNAGAVPGVVANNWLPFGTRVSVPALGIVGYVHDHIGYGTEFDFVSNNPFALTGCYQVVIG